MKTKIFNISHIILFALLIIFNIFYYSYYSTTPKSMPFFITFFGILIYANIFLFIFRMIKLLDNSTKIKKIFNYITIISLIALAILSALERFKFVTGEAISPIFFLLVGINLILLITRVIFKFTRRI